MQKKISIAIISASANYVGGHWVQAKQIIDKLKDESSVLAIHFPIDPQFPKLFSWVKKVAYLRTIFNTALYIFLLFLKIGKFDVLHIFSASYFSFLLAPAPAVFIGRLFGKKIILNYHSGEAEDHLKRSYWIINNVFKRVDTLVVPSLYLKEVFERFGFHAVAIFNVVDLEIFAFKKRGSFKPKFLVNRSLEPMYNVSCILKAFRIIQDYYPEAELIVIGHGSEANTLKSHANDLSLKNISFAGAVGHQNMPEYFARADFFLNTSNIDNMPISILEAFASGLPVISTNAGGIPYIIEDNRNGFLVDLNDHEAVAKKAIFLLRNQEEATRLSYTAREDCEKYYSWEANREKWLKLYSVL